RSFQNVAKQPDDGGIAGTVRDEEAEDRAARHRKADVIHRGEIAEALCQPLALDHRVAHKEEENLEARKPGGSNWISKISGFLASRFISRSGKRCRRTRSEER